MTEDLLFDALGKIDNPFSTDRCMMGFRQKAPATDTNDLSHFSVMEMVLFELRLPTRPG